jgi:hypothetical protein
MDRIEARSAPLRIEVDADRRGSLAVAVLCSLYALLLGSLFATGRLAVGDAHGIEGVIVLAGMSITVPLMLWMASQRTFRLEGDRLFVSGPFGAGGRTYVASDAKLRSMSTQVAGQPAYRLIWTLPGVGDRVMCTWVASRYPLVEALRVAMSPGATRAQIDALAELARTEMEARRNDFLSFVGAACVSIAASAWWLWH